MAAPCDACFFPDEELNPLKDRVRMALKLGYSSIIINNVVDFNIKGGVKRKKGKTKPPGLEIVPSETIKLPEETLASLKAVQTRSREIQQLTRVTAVLSEYEQAVKFKKDEIVQGYDILAVQPTTEKLFQVACQTMEIDMITLDLTCKLPFYMKKPQVRVAVDRGIHFEICYSPMIRDEAARKYTIATAQKLVKLCKGKNIIISSAAEHCMQLRGLYDVAALGLLFNLTEAQANDAVTNNCRRLIMRAKARRSMKCAVTLGKASELPPGEQWKLPEEENSEEEGDEEAGEEDGENPKVEAGEEEEEDLEGEGKEEGKAGEESGKDPVVEEEEDNEEPPSKKSKKYKKIRSL